MSRDVIDRVRKNALSDDGVKGVGVKIVTKTRGPERDRNFDFDLINVISHSERWAADFMYITLISDTIGDQFQG